MRTTPPLLLLSLTVMLGVSDAALTSDIGVRGRNLRGCFQGDFNATTEAIDMFPDRTVADHSLGWSIEYKNFYKKVQVTWQEGGQTQTQVRLLVQCFKDSEETRRALVRAVDLEGGCQFANGCGTITIPVMRAGAIGGTVGLLEDLDVADTVKYTNFAPVSPCLQHHKPLSANPADPAQLDAVDAYFVDVPLSQTDRHPKQVYTPFRLEQRPAQRVEWVQFLGAFYNRESWAAYVVFRSLQSYDVQEAKALTFPPNVRFVAWVTQTTHTHVSLLADSSFQYVVGSSGATVPEFGETLDKYSSEWQEVFRRASAIVLDVVSTHTSLATAREALGLPEDYNISIYQPNRHQSAEASRSGNPFDEYMTAAPDLVLSDICKMTIGNEAPWKDVPWVFFRRVTEAPQNVAADPEACGKGFVRPVEEEEVRRTLMSQVSPAGATNILSGGITGTFRPSADYFPDKVYPSRAKHFSVAYHLNWKLVRGNNPRNPEKSEEDYILIQRGTPENERPPAHVLPHARRLEVPLNSFTVTATPEATVFDFLGTWDEMLGVPQGPVPCMLRGMAMGKYVKLPTFGLKCDTMGSTDPRRPMVDVDAIFGTSQALENCGPPLVHAAMTSDPGVLERAEWILFLSTFVNLEKLGQQRWTAIEEKYLCNRQIAQQVVASAGRRPSVAFVTSRHWNTGKPVVASVTYEKELVETSGGRYAVEDSSLDETLPNERERLPDGTVSFTDYAVLRQWLRGLDVLIDTTYYPQTPNLSQVLESFQLSENDTDIPVVRNRKIYRLDKRYVEMSGFTEQFGRYVTEPDAVIEDMVFILHPEVSRSQSTHFFRNMFTDEVNYITGDACPGFDAPSELLTTGNHTCTLPCSERRSAEYCDTTCWWRSWDNTCYDAPVVQPGDDNNNNNGKGDAASATVPFIFSIVAVLAFAVL